MEGTGLKLVVPPFFRPHIYVRFAVGPLEDFVSVSTATPYSLFGRAAPGRVQNPTATGFTPTTGSLGQGILTTPTLSGIRKIVTQKSYQRWVGLSNKHKSDLIDWSIWY